MNYPQSSPDLMYFLTLQEAAERDMRMTAARSRIRTGPIQIYQLSCECMICREQSRTVSQQRDGLELSYTGCLTDSEAAALARSFRERLFADLRVVRSALRSEEDMIRRFWLKKSNTKRRALLRKLRPHMGDSHDAFDGLQTIDETTMLTWQFRETLLLPYLTVENISIDGTRLLRLLHYRGFHTPEQWVAFDNRQLREGWRTGMLDEKFNDGCITIHGEAYGIWKSFDEEAGKQLSATCQQIMSQD